MAVVIDDEKRAEFLRYLFEFYGELGTYPLEPPLRKEEATWALDVLLRGDKFEGDSHDRELARDLVHAARGVTLSEEQWRAVRRAIVEAL